MRYSVRGITEFFVAGCTDVGMSELAASRTVAHLVASDYLGRHAHGIYRMSSVLADRYSTRDPIIDAPSARVAVSAPGWPGIAAMARACEAAESRTGPDDVTLVAVTDFIGLTGSLGWFAYMLADRGLGSILMCNSDPALAIPGTGVPFGGTNPLAIGLPGVTPFVGDFASTVMSHGDITVSRLTGGLLPEGVVVDSEGRPSTRHDDAEDGAILGFGSHKGFVLSIAIEMLCGMLAGAKIGTEPDTSRGAVLIVFRASGSCRPDAVDVARSALRMAHDSGRLSGERLAEVPPEFLWTGTSETASAWADNAEIDVPQGIVDFLEGNGVSLP